MAGTHRRKHHFIRGHSLGIASASDTSSRTSTVRSCSTRSFWVSGWHIRRGRRSPAWPETTSRYGSAAHRARVLARCPTDVARNPAGWNRLVFEVKDLPARVDEMNGRVSAFVMRSSLGLAGSRFWWRTRAGIQWNYSSLQPGPGSNERSSVAASADAGFVAIGSRPLACGRRGLTIQRRHQTSPRLHAESCSQ